MVDKNQFYRELDGMPEHQIRATITRSLWRDEKQKLAELYLTEKEAERQKVVNAEGLSIARSGTDAAWESAKAAKGANKRATWAVIISIASLAIAAWPYIRPRVIDAAAALKAWFAVSWGTGA